MVLFGHEAAGSHPRGSRQGFAEMPSSVRGASGTPLFGARLLISFH